MSVPTIRSLRADDHDVWCALYREYGSFYEQPKGDEALAALWPRVQGPRAEVEALVAVDAEDRPIGLVHVREFPRPLDGSRGLYLDDFVVDPDHRGRGIARALLAHLAGVAAERGLSGVRWTTMPDNAVARGLYDQVATLSPMLTYDLVVERD